MMEEAKLRSGLGAAQIYGIPREEWLQLRVRERRETGRARNRRICCMQLQVVRFNHTFAPSVMHASKPNVLVLVCLVPSPSSRLATASRRHHHHHH